MNLKATAVTCPSLPGLRRKGATELGYLKEWDRKAVSWSNVSTSLLMRVCPTPTTSKPSPASAVEPLVKQNPIVDEWVSYATQYGRKVATFDEKTRSAIRFTMEKVIYEASNKTTNSAATAEHNDDL